MINTYITLGTQYFETNYHIWNQSFYMHVPGTHFPYFAFDIHTFQAVQKVIMSMSLTHFVSLLDYL